MIRVDNNNQTGNKKLDEKIALALRKGTTDWEKFIGVPEETTYATLEKGKARIQVADKVDRTYKDGIVFASRGEMNRWDYLLNIQRAGEIKDLERQIPFELQPGFYSPIHGKIEPILYVADFVYTNLTFRPGFENFRVIEDHKGGYTTEVFKLKRKLMLHRYPQYLFYEVS